MEKKNNILWGITIEDKETKIRYLIKEVTFQSDNFKLAMNVTTAEDSKDAMFFESRDACLLIAHLLEENNNTPFRDVRLVNIEKEAFCN